MFYSFQGNDTGQLDSATSQWMAARLDNIMISILFRYILMLTFLIRPANINRIDTQLLSWGWTDPIPDPIHLEDFLK